MMSPDLNFVVVDSLFELNNTKSPLVVVAMNVSLDTLIRPI